MKTQACDTVCHPDDLAHLSVYYVPAHLSDRSSETYRTNSTSRTCCILTVFRSVLIATASQQHGDCSPTMSVILFPGQTATLDQSTHPRALILNINVDY